MTVYTKCFPSKDRCQRAAANYRWLAGLGPPLTLPRLIRQYETRTDYQYIPGRHAEPRDLQLLATHLGAVHATAHNAELREARLDRDYVGPSGHLITDFVTSRARAVQTRLAAGAVPEPPDADTVLRLLANVADAPATFYKDVNPRNLLITSHRPTPTTVDFDDLTLAPFGYDLAKLIVTLAMTHGRIPPPEINRALVAYNVSITRWSPNLAPITWNDLLLWAELHHILTSPYIGRGHYRYGWHELRPTGIANSWKSGRHAQPLERSRATVRSSPKGASQGCGKDRETPSASCPTN